MVTICTGKVPSDLDSGDSVVKNGRSGPGSYWHEGMIRIENSDRIYSWQKGRTGTGVPHYLILYHQKTVDMGR